jgi:precorrin-3B synthase
VNIRGSCPGVVTPMQTGDGLLARIISNEPIAIDALCSLSDAAEAQGNGIIEVTQRGSLQVRGLTAASAPRFAQIVLSLGIGADNSPPLLTSPLLGLSADEPFDSTMLVSDLRALLQDGRSELQGLGPKVSVLVDGGGSLHLDAVPADIRLVATSDSSFALAIAGDASTASFVGYVSMNRVAARVRDLLRQIATRGPAARAKDLVPELALASTPSSPRPPSQPIGIHWLKDGTVARGFALPFGHTTAAALRRLARSAENHGAKAVRPAPGRTLLAIGLSQACANELCTSATEEGLIVDASDARRHVVACAGTPACASAKLPTRQLAPEVARAARVLVGTSNVVHLSGCGKGCAHPGPAAVTIVGPDRIVINGRAGDAPHATASPAGLLADIERLCSELNLAG